MSILGQVIMAILVIVSSFVFLIIMVTGSVLLIVFLVQWVYDRIKLWRLTR